MVRIRYIPTLIAVLALALLLSACFTPSPAAAQDTSSPTECAAMPEQSAEILAHYGLAVVKRLTLAGSRAQDFMRRHNATDDQRAGVSAIVFWKITGVPPGESPVSVGDFILLHTSIHGCLLRMIVFMPASQFPEIEGEPA